MLSLSWYQLDSSINTPAPKVRYPLGRRVHSEAPWGLGLVDRSLRPVPLVTEVARVLWQSEVIKMRTYAVALERHC